jgi:hypothetical protein
MATMTFGEYLEDCLDLHASLMSAEALAEARRAFERMCHPAAKPAAHPDMKLAAGDLRDRCARLTSSQTIAIEKFSADPAYQIALVAARAAVAEGRRLLSGRATKADYIAHAALNSDASRAINAVTSARGR